MSSKFQQLEKSEASSVVGELARFCEAIHAPADVAGAASLICGRSVQKGLGRGRPPSLLAIASLYAACREKAFPATLDDLASASGAKSKKIALQYRLLVNELGLSMPVPNPLQYVARVAIAVHASDGVRSRAVRMILRAEEKGALSGMNPIGAAASALYLASALEGERLTQRRAAEAAGVRLATLRSAYLSLRRTCEV